jgi:hypothetical protein
MFFPNVTMYHKFRAQTKLYEKLTMSNINVSQTLHDKCLFLPAVTPEMR